MAATSEKPVNLAWHSPEFYRLAHPSAEPRVRFMEHKGTRVLLIDFSRANVDVVRAVSAECLHVMAAEPLGSVLSLCDMEGIPFSPEGMKVGSELTDRCAPYALRSAISPVGGFRSFVLQTLADAAKQKIRLFNDRTTALDWLVKGD